MPADRANKAGRRRLEPRKKPLQDRANATVATILEAAAIVIERHDGKDFNTNAIAERAGVSIGSLYQYFPNKDALAAALIRLHAQAFLQELDEAVSATGSAPLEAGIAAMVHVAVRQQTTRPRLARFLDKEERRLPVDEEVGATYAAISDKIRHVLYRAGLALAPDQGTRVVRDLLNIARAMIDDADSRELREELESRVCAAINGYLTHSSLLPLEANRGS